MSLSTWIKFGLLLMIFVVTNVSSECAWLESQLSECKQGLAAQQRRVSFCDTALESAENQVANFRKQLQEKENQLDATTSALRNAQIMVQTLERDLAALEQSYEEARTELTQTLEELQHL